MREYVVNRPDAGAMRTLLERESDPEGLIVRLAWLAGLSRDEIAALCWEQVSFMDERLELPDRTIPMAEELRSYLWRLYQNRKSESPYVVVSERYGDRMQPRVHLPAGPAGAGPERAERCAADGSAPRLDHSPA